MNEYPSVWAYEQACIVIERKRLEIIALKNECNHARRYFRIILDCNELAEDVAQRFVEEFGEEEYV